jgi:hypothetical protein
MSTQVLIAPIIYEKGKNITKVFYYYFYYSYATWHGQQFLFIRRGSFFLSKERNICFQFEYTSVTLYITSDEYSQKVDTSIGYADYIQS